MKTLIVGGGNMGKTFARSFLDAHILRRSDLSIIEVSTDQRNHLIEKNLGQVLGDYGDFIKKYDLVVLAVKPQSAENVYSSLKPFLTNQQVILSIMAGIKMENIAKGLGIDKVIRAMPNLPAQIGMGMTAFTAMDNVTRNELISVQNLLSTTGKAIYFENENMIDAATAISGSGPAYVYYFMDSMMKSARKMGFSESESDLLVWQTFLGSIHLLNKQSLTCEEWISRVSSKGGTTEAAIKTFNSTNVETGIKDGLKAAFDRAKELGEMMN